MRNASAALTELRELIENVRVAARELSGRGMKPGEIAQVYRLSEGTVRDLLSERAALSPATTRELLQRARRRA